MLHRLRSLFIVLSFGAIVGGIAVPVSAAVDYLEPCPPDAKDSALCKPTNKDEDSATSLAQDIINLLLFLIGIVSVIMIVVGGFHYVVSNGDSNKIASAKNTIMYAVVGLVVAILASAIVNFVVDQFTP